LHKILSGHLPEDLILNALRSEWMGLRGLAAQPSEKRWQVRKGGRHLFSLTAISSWAGIDRAASNDEPSTLLRAPEQLSAHLIHDGRHFG